MGIRSPAEPLDSDIVPSTLDCPESTHRQGVFGSLEAPLRSARPGIRIYIMVSYYRI